MTGSTIPRACVSQAIRSPVTIRARSTCDNNDNNNNVSNYSRPTFASSGEFVFADLSAKHCFPLSDAIVSLSHGGNADFPQIEKSVLAIDFIETPTLIFTNVFYRFHLRSVSCPRFQ